MADIVRPSNFGPQGPTGATGPQGPAGGGSFAATQVVVTLPYSKRNHTGITVIDAAVSATSRILLSLAGVAETLANSSDTIDLLNMQAVPAVGSFEFQASFFTPVGGPLTINYTIG